MAVIADFTTKLLSSVNALEKDIGIPTGFFNRLLKDDDWSFIIKLNSLFEAALTRLLMEELDRKELEETISLLELANVKIGKIAFARSLNLLGSSEEIYIRKLSELRNKLVHNVTNVDFNLNDYIKDFGKDKLKQFANSVGFRFKDKFEINGRIFQRYQYFKENPKMTIWIGALGCLNSIYEQKTSAKLYKTNPLLKKYMRNKI